MGILFFLFLLILGCAPAPKQARPVASTAIKPLDVFILLDQSSSMKETDPENQRIEAAKFLVNYLAAYWSRDQNHRIGVVNFGDLKPVNPEDEIGELVSLDSSELAARERLLTKIKPLDLRYTNFIGALRNARQGFERGKSDIPRQRVIILLTDGEPDDPRKLSREAYFREIVSFFNDSLKDCLLCVIGIDREDRFWSKTKPYWDKVACYTQRLASANERELKEAFWKVVSVLLEGVAENWEPLPPEGLQVEIDPYLEAVTFTIHRELPDAQVSILDPKGKVLVEAPPRVSKVLETSRTVVWKVEEPEAGVWVCRLEKGKGRVEVGTTRIPVVPRVLYPATPHPLGKPFLIYASFLRRDGKPIKQHRAYELKMWADLRYPNGSAGHLDLIETFQPGIFVARETVNPIQEGEYQIVLNMKAHKLISETILPLKVAPMPYVQLLKPTPGEVQPLRRGLVIEAAVRQGGEEIDPTDYFLDNPNALIFYQIEDTKRGEIVKSGHLDYFSSEKMPRFRAGVGKIKGPGRYRLVLNLRGEERGGAEYTYTTPFVEGVFTRRMDVLDFVFARFYLFGVFALFGLFLWDWQRIFREHNHWMWRLGMPRLSGKITVIDRRTRSAVVESYLSGRKLRLGGTGCSIFIPESSGTLAYLVAKWVRNPETGKREQRVELRTLDPKSGGIKGITVLSDGDNTPIDDNHSLSYQM